MIASVRGEVLVRRPDHVVIESGGVGYRLTVSAETLKAVPAAGKEATLHAHLVARDDSLQLYGFASEEERDLFLHLTSVSGIGPKVAIAILSGGTPRELLRAIAAGDAKRFQAVPGIGKRTSERVIVELREKVAGELEEGVPALDSGAGDDPRTLARSLRPRRLADFVNQEQVTEQLAVFIEAARGREEPLDHVLLAGPPGLGKTSLAHIIAAELEAPLVQTAGPALERKADIAAFLTALEPGSVFFIDEIHRLSRAIEETLYPAMEERRLPVVLGQGAGARTVTLDLPPFTLVGATTRAGLLTTPLRDRFGVAHRLEHYDAPDLARIVRRSAGILEVEIEPGGEQAIAERARGTPRVANRLLKRVRDFAEVRGAGVVTGDVAREALGLLEVDAAGLDRHDRAILDAIATKFSGGPVGLSTLAAAVDEEQDTIEDVYEPYLLQQGLIKRTPRGRVMTERGFEHLGLAIPDRAASLF